MFLRPIVTIVSNKQLKYIEKHLYLSDSRAALDELELKNYNIERIIYLCPEDDKDLPHFSGIYYMRLTLNWQPFEQIITYFGYVHQYIREAQTFEENLLICCPDGQTWSAAICVAFLMKRYNLSTDGAVATLMDCKSDVNLNQFRLQLNLWQYTGHTIRADNTCIRQYIFDRLIDRVKTALPLPSFGGLSLTNSMTIRKALTFMKLLNEKDFQQRLIKIFLHYLRIIGFIEDMDPNFKLEPIISCKTCGSVLVCRSQILTAGGTDDLSIHCSDIYVELTQWIAISMLKNIANDITGQLLCPNCNQQVGDYDWCRDVDSYCRCRRHFAIKRFQFFRITDTNVNVLPSMVNQYRDKHPK
ncbi:dual specificity protein phosphatase 12-like [Oppia nitens]|uniref:dual specificity protein phosphatase 12-like n=1 Tax=Oppia nitens TaxID=1686743 RepID=UPI0023DAD168|nr:dual specificity protein phosphatase 12-like [Oppia nitens]